MMTLIGHINSDKISNFKNQRWRTATVRKTVKSKYLSNGLTVRRKIWHDDDIGPMNFTLQPHTLTVLRTKTAKIFLKTKSGFSFFSL